MRFCFEKKEFIEHHIEPNQLAIIDNQREITWLQFESEVNKICSFFILNQWDKLSNPVILYGHKKAEMITVIYALMKLKITYIPIDVIYPKHRITTIKQLAGAEIILNCTDTIQDLENTIEVLVKPNELNIVKQHALSLSEKTFEIDPLVYIIFTSGSTGKPKGVQITSEAVQTFTKWMTHDFGFSSKDVFINIAVFSFDLSVYELMSFGALGATLLLNDKATSENQEQLMNRIKDYKGTVWVSTPSFALAYTRIGADPRLDSLKYFLFCGETLPHSIASNLHNSFPSSIIYNTYGPTEATVATTKIEITQKILDTFNPLPIGFPKPKCEILIIKENPEDIVGELIIVGDHVSIGYLKNNELNKQKFFTYQGQRAFKTGDLGYYKDGMLFCKGRNDDQIKMHGFRIELDEISQTLISSGLVKEAVTVGLKRNNEVKKIISFIIPANEIDLNQLKAFLQKSLPYYMIPGDIDIVDEFPFNTNFKIDKNKLIDEYLKRQLNS